MQGTGFAVKNYTFLFIYYMRLFLAPDYRLSNPLIVIKTTYQNQGELHMDSGAG